MATQVFHKGAGEYGLLGTTMAIGSLSGALVAARRVGRPRQRLLVGAALAFGAVEVVSGLMPSYLTFTALTPLIGLSALTLITAANASVQLSVTPAMRGRVMALYMMIFQGGTPLGAPIVGWVGHSLGARWTLIGGGGMTLIGVVAAVAVFSWSRGLIGHHHHDSATADELVRAA
jgi:predicted MFS family arabinose efflux permease